MSQPCELISWSRVYQLSRRLAFQLRDSDFRPDIVVAIGRGGYVPARILCDFLDIYELRGLRIEHYKRGVERQAVARVVYPLCTEIAGQSLLIVDDVSDTGDTFDVAIDHVLKFHPGEVRTAVLHHKAVSSYEPHFYAQKVVKWRWLIYPWAVMEDLTGFVDGMGDRPTSLEELQRRLIKRLQDQCIEAYPRGCPASYWPGQGSKPTEKAR